VVAVEPNKEMIASRYQEFTYQQLNGSLEVLTNFADNSFDFVICHNVLEYVQNREEIVSEFLVPFTIIKQPFTHLPTKHLDFMLS
jgi:Methylase involved in ubiquinone/menaquinone biosynthesis